MGWKFHVESWVFRDWRWYYLTENIIDLLQRQYISFSLISSFNKLHNLDIVITNYCHSPPSQFYKTCTFNPLLTQDEVTYSYSFTKSACIEKFGKLLRLKVILPLSNSSTFVYCYCCLGFLIAVQQPVNKVWDLQNPVTRKKENSLRLILLLRAVFKGRQRGY